MSAASEMSGPCVEWDRWSRALAVRPPSNLLAHKKAPVRPDQLRPADAELDEGRKLQQLR